MRMTSFSPRKELVPFVSSVVVAEAPQLAEGTLLPHLGIVFGLRYAGQATLIEAGSSTVMPDTILTGLRSTARRVRTSAGGGAVSIKLRELSAQAFFREPIHHLFGQTRRLEDFFSGADVRDLSTRVRRASADEERVSIFQQFLVDRCSGRDPDPTIAEAVRLIGQDPGGVRMAQVAKEVALSQDAFEKRFRRIVGMSPKAYASLLHFKRALDSYARARTTMTQLAFEAGFCDQSHFIRRFRAVTGAPPGRLLGSGDYW
jgi:AraC-like DNA-binding protein